MARWLTTICFRLKLVRAQGVRGGVVVCALALGVAGLLLVVPSVSAGSAQAGGGQAMAVSPFKGRPTRTPTATPTATATPTTTAAPSPAPTSTLAPSPTAAPTKAATAIPSTAVTRTVDAGAESEDESGSGDKDALTAAASLSPLLGWGLTALVAALLIFGTFLVWFTRRAAAYQGPRFAPLAQMMTSPRMRKLRQFLPGRQAARPRAAEPPDDDSAWEDLPPPPLKPPRWLTEAGLGPSDSAELPAAIPPAPRGTGKGTLNGPEQGDSSLPG